MPFLNEQLHFIYSLQEIRGPLVDAIFYCLNFLDTDYFACSLIAFIWLGCSWRWGVRLGYLFIVSGLINAIAKLAFGWPRPFFFDPSLAIVKLHDYGFPSGGSQNAMLLGCLLMYTWKSKWSPYVGIFYILLVSFSRIFLGVHFPLDVLGGWIIGALLFYGFVRSYSTIEEMASRYPRRMMMGTLLAAVLIALIFRDFKTVFLMSSLIPMTVGVYFSTKNGWYLTLPSEIWKKIVIGLLGIITAALVALPVRLLPLQPMLSIILQVAVSGLWISLGASPVFKKFFRS